MNVQYLETAVNFLNTVFKNDPEILENINTAYANNDISTIKEYLKEVYTFVHDINDNLE